MADSSFDPEEINRLINSIWDNHEINFSLRLQFEEKIKELGISSNQVEKGLEIAYRTLNGILDGDLTRFDLLSLLKVGLFLGISEKDVFELYLKFVIEKHKTELTQAKRAIFIFNNFDLQSLRNIGIITSVQDIGHIETQLTSIFALRSIIDYNVEDTGAVLSSTKRIPKNDKNRKYFKSKSKSIFKLIDNPNRYEKQSLIEYFPKIRWHSLNVDNGLINVIKSLFELGVTVIFQPKMPNLQLRGATMVVNDKPCIILTDYMNSYPSMWFAMLHELFHVLFDWDEISTKKYHLSDEENDLDVVREKEEEANDFAREYLFPKNKLEFILPRIRHTVIVKEFAIENHVHPSIVYDNYANLMTSNKNAFWSGFESQVKPPIDNLISKLANDLSHQSTVVEFANYYKASIFNNQ